MHLNVVPNFPFDRVIKSMNRDGSIVTSVSVTHQCSSRIQPDHNTSLTAVLVPIELSSIENRTSIRIDH